MLEKVSLHFCQAKFKFSTSIVQFKSRLSLKPGYYQITFLYVFKVGNEFNEFASDKNAFIMDFIWLFKE